VIFRFAGHRIVGVDRVVDDFALWAGIRHVETQEKMP